jgi:hypothetical protein
MLARDWRLCDVPGRDHIDAVCGLQQLSRGRPRLTMTASVAQGRRTRQCSISGSYRGVNRRLADVAARTVLDPHLTPGPSTLLHCSRVTDSISAIVDRPVSSPSNLNRSPKRARMIAPPTASQHSWPMRPCACYQPGGAIPLKKADSQCWRKHEPH